MGYEVDYRDVEYMYTLGSRRVYFPKADAYKGIIKAAYQSTSLRGMKMLVVELDINEGMFKDFFKKLYNIKQQYNATGYIKWECKYYNLLEGDNWSNNRLKNFLFCVENNNEGYVFDWENQNNLESLKDKNVCFTLNYDYVYNKNFGVYMKTLSVESFLTEENMKEGNYSIEKVKNPNDDKFKNKIKIATELEIKDER